MLRPKSAAIAVILCAGAFGCGKKVPECNALIKQLNESSTAMQAATTALQGKQRKEGLPKFVETTKAEKEKLAKLELTLPELQGFSKGYQALLADSAAAAQGTSKAEADLELFQEAVTKASSGWMSAVTKLNVACIKARRECSSLGDKVTRQPSITGTKPEEEANKLDEYAKGLASIDAKNPDVKAALEELKKNVADFSGALRKSGAALSDAEKARKIQTDASAKEPALIKSINDFCQAS